MVPTDSTGNPARMPKRKQKSKRVSCTEFRDALEENEAHMAEMAAMAITCEQFGITEEEGYDLLIEADALDNGNT